MNSTVAFRQLEDIIELKNERIKSLEAKVNENQSLRETLEKVTNQLLKAQGTCYFNNNYSHNSFFRGN